MLLRPAFKPDLLHRRPVSTLHPGDNPIPSHGISIREPVVHPLDRPVCRLPDRTRERISLNEDPATKIHPRMLEDLSDDLIDPLRVAADLRLDVGLRLIPFRRGRRRTVPQHALSSQQTGDLVFKRIMVHPRQKDHHHRAFAPLSSRLRPDSCFRDLPAVPYPYRHIRPDLRFLRRKTGYIDVARGFTHPLHQRDPPKGPFNPLLENLIPPVHEIGIARPGVGLSFLVISFPDAPLLGLDAVLIPDLCDHPPVMEILKQDRNLSPEVLASCRKIRNQEIRKSIWRSPDPERLVHQLDQEEKCSDPGTNLPFGCPIILLADALVDLRGEDIVPYQVGALLGEDEVCRNDRSQGIFCEGTCAIKGQPQLVAQLGAHPAPVNTLQDPLPEPFPGRQHGIIKHQNILILNPGRQTRPVKVAGDLTADRLQHPLQRFFHRLLLPEDRLAENHVDILRLEGNPHREPTLKTF